MSKKKYYWTTKEGKEIDVDELTPEHMRKIIKHFLRQEKEEEQIRRDIQKWNSNFLNFRTHD